MLEICLKHKIIYDFLKNYKEEKWNIIIPSLLEIAILKLYSSFEKYFFSEKDLLLINKKLKSSQKYPTINSISNGTLKIIKNNYSLDRDTDIGQFRKYLELNNLQNQSNSNRSFSKKAININELNIYNNRNKSICFNETNSLSSFNMLMNYKKTKSDKKNIIRITRLNKDNYYNKNNLDENDYNIKVNSNYKAINNYVTNSIYFNKMNYLNNNFGKKNISKKEVIKNKFNLNENNNYTQKKIIKSSSSLNDNSSLYEQPERKNSEIINTKGINRYNNNIININKSNISKKLFKELKINKFEIIKRNFNKHILFYRNIKNGYKFKQKTINDISNTDRNNTDRNIDDIKYLENNIDLSKNNTTENLKNYHTINTDILKKRIIPPSKLINNKKKIINYNYFNSNINTKNSISLIDHLLFKRVNPSEKIFFKKKSHIINKV